MSQQTPGIDPRGLTEGETVVLVDLDGTLLRSDILWESLMVLARRRPWSLLVMVYYVFQGRARFKEELAKRVVIDATTLPYCSEVIAGIEEHRLKGRRVILATATIETVANAVAEHLGIFDSVLATSGGVNRKGAAKLAAIVEQFEGFPFEYWGDSTADFPLFEAACQCVVVRPKGSVRQYVATLNKPVRIIESPERRFKVVLRSLRLWKWPKNLLLFTPLLFAENVSGPEFAQAAIAVLAFSLFASANYLIGDLLDLSSDRLDAKRRNRPLASGSLPIPSGIQLSATLVAASLGISVIFLPWSFLSWLILYALASHLRTLWLTRWWVLDITLLAILVTLRIPAGATAMETNVPLWVSATCFGLAWSVHALARFQAGAMRR